MNFKEFAKEVLEKTGKDVYLVELEVAENLFWTHHGDAENCWEEALTFIKAMKETYEKYPLARCVDARVAADSPAKQANE